MLQAFVDALTDPDIKSSRSTAMSIVKSLGIEYKSVPNDGLENNMLGSTPLLFWQLLQTDWMF